MSDPTTIANFLRVALQILGGRDNTGDAAQIIRASIEHVRALPAKPSPDRALGLLNEAVLALVGDQPDAAA